MADLVQKKMEMMLPGLEHWVKQELFTPEEVRAIVKRRRQLEYKMTRKIPLRSDFKRAIEYETKLLKLTLSRQASLGEEYEKSQHDFSVQSRIQDIFRNALRKFDDLDLWDAYLSFLIQVKSFKIANSEFVRALELHPNVVQLWIRAAIFSFDHLNDIQAAQVLCQRAIRVHPKNVEIWLTFFTMMCKQYQQFHREEDLSLLSSIHSHAMESLPSSLDTHVRFIHIMDELELDVQLRSKALEYIIQHFGDQQRAWIVYADHLAIEQALEMFKSHISEHDGVVHKAMARFLYTKGMEQEHFHPAVFETLSELVPSGDIEAIRMLLSSYLCCGMVDQALSTCQQISSTLSQQHLSQLHSEFPLLFSFTM